MTVVEIEYSVPHGYRRRAEDIEQMIEEELGGVVESVDLLEGEDMDFIVRVDGQRVWDKKKDGYKPESVLAELKQAVPEPEPDEAGGEEE